MDEKTIKKLRRLYTNKVYAGRIEDLIKKYFTDRSMTTAERDVLWDILSSCKVILQHYDTIFISPTVWLSDQKEYVEVSIRRNFSFEDRTNVMSIYRDGRIKIQYTPDMMSLEKQAINTFKQKCGLAG